jgi:ubiquitin
VHELNEDELTFETPVLAKMYRIISDALSENNLLKSAYFLRLDDQEIVKFVTDIEMKSHELSANWYAKYKIYTNSEQDKIKQASMGAIYAFKASKVEKRIIEIRKALQNKEIELSGEEQMDLLSEQVQLEGIKKIISDKLGRIVLR